MPIKLADIQVIYSIRIGKVQFKLKLKDEMTADFRVLEFLAYSCP